MNHARKPVNAQRMAEGAILVITCSAALAWMAAHLLVRAVKAAARGAWKRLMRRLYRSSMRQAAVDAGLTPPLARRTGPWEPAPEPTTPPPGWTHTNTPSAAELTMYDEPAPLRRPR